MLWIIFVPVITISILSIGSFALTLFTALLRGGGLTWGEAIAVYYLGIILIISLYISNFILYNLTFISITEGRCNKYIRFFTTFIMLYFLALIISYFWAIFSNFLSYEIRIFVRYIAFRLSPTPLLGMAIVQSIMLVYGIKKTNNKKWLLIAYFIPIVGTICYFKIGRNKIN